ncbi:MAG: hypothetical protein WC998_08785 [Candidatus Paceibacterota bacterium]
MASLKKAIVIIVAFCIVILLVGGIFLLQDYIIQRVDELNSPAPQITERAPSSPQYGCPGCPTNFMDFAQDMCNRFGSNYTVSDGTNTLSCVEITSGETK